METKNSYNEFWISEISRFLKGELTYSQEQELHDWINKDEKNALVYKEIRNSWLAAITFDSEMDGTDKIWEQLVQRADHTKKGQKQAGQVSF
ncbi:MAG: hypothetical protein HC830_04220 [Bacteroidetes bacterium]|nr:hypothetical protein [Bacteroidota bacterium]